MQRSEKESVYLEKMRNIVFELDVALSMSPRAAHAKRGMHAFITRTKELLNEYIADQEKQHPLEDEDLLVRADTLVADVEKFADQHHKREKYQQAISYLFNGALAIGDIIDDESLGE